MAPVFSTIDLHFLGEEHTIAAFLVITDFGPVLVETGPYSTWDYLKNGVQRLGFEMGEIRHVFLTHIHFDHAGAAWALAELGANIYVHPLGALHLQSPERLLESARRIYGDQMDRLWGAIQPIAPERIRIADHEATFRLGNTVFKAWHTPGHAVHHIAWQVEDVLFTGDIAGVSINGGLVVPPCPPPDIQLDHWRQSIQLIRELKPATLQLTHFGKVTNVNAHLEALETRMNAWEQWMLPHYQAGHSMEEIIPLFQEFTNEELRQNGISDADLEKYNKANPVGMSVSGLMRYLKKKESA